MYQTNDFKFLIDVLWDPRAFHEYDYSYINFYLIFKFILIINYWFYLLYTDVFTTIHKHPLFVTPYCRTTFRLLAHVSMLQYSIPSNVLAFRRTLTHIFVEYPCISSSWTQWVKNNNRPNHSQEIEKGFGMSKFSLFKLPLFIFFYS